MVEDQSDGLGSNKGANSRVDDGEEYAMKARKPYTITKQREKWTQEEHKRFVEALKLYGRSWRQIEEHMGNRTAIQIRSHAQKFFSKVVRETNHGTEGRVIEIPPPRPKRKPTRPYPRKVSIPLKKGGACHGSSISHHENMSTSSRECVSTQSLKLFGKTMFVTGSTTGDAVATLPWNSMPTLAPECPTTRSLSGYGDFAYRIQQSSGRIEPTQCCVGEESSVLTGEEREELRMRLCL